MIWLLFFIVIVPAPAPTDLNAGLEVILAEMVSPKVKSLYEWAWVKKDESFTFTHKKEDNNDSN